MGGRPRAEKKPLQILRSHRWAIDDGSEPFVLLKDGRYDFLNGVYLGKVGTFRARKNNELSARFTWRQYGGTIFFKNITEESFTADFEINGIAEKGHWKGTALTEVKRFVRFRWKKKVAHEESVTRFVEPKKEDELDSALQSRSLNT